MSRGAGPGVFHGLRPPQGSSSQKQRVQGRPHGRNHEDDHGCHFDSEGTILFAADSDAHSLVGLAWLVTTTGVIYLFWGTKAEGKQI